VILSATADWQQIAKIAVTAKIAIIEEPRLHREPSPRPRRPARSKMHHHTAGIIGQLFQIVAIMAVMAIMAIPLSPYNRPDLY
jgi:hypothetical protein